MGYLVELGANNELLIPDELSTELKINVGDIMLCEKAENSNELILTKHSNQSLSDAEIAAAGNLTRVFSYAPG